MLNGQNFAAWGEPIRRGM